MYSRSQADPYNIRLSHIKLRYVIIIGTHEGADAESGVLKGQGGYCRNNIEYFTFLGLESPAHQLKTLWHES